MPKLKSILLIDDDEVTNFINNELLSELDAANHIHICENGKLGLDYLRKAHNQEDEEHKIPDLILLDMNMPVMNGKEFLVEYNKQFRDCNSVIVMLSTAQVRDEVFEALKDTSLVVTFLEKPLDKTKVIQTIESVNRVYYHNCPPENNGKRKN